MGTHVGILALQGDVREHERQFAELGASTSLVRTTQDLARVDALVLPGGESTTMWRLARAFGLFDPVRTAIRDGLPAYGTCAGMIMLADRLENGVPGQESQETFGGMDVLVRRNAFGRQVDSFETPLHFSVLGDPPATAVFIRAPWVEHAGPEVEVLATVATGPAAGKIVAIRQGTLLATSFHPELTADSRVHALFLSMLKES